MSMYRNGLLRNNGSVHIIDVHYDVRRNNGALSGSSHDDHPSRRHFREHVYQFLSASSIRLNSIHSSFMRRVAHHGPLLRSIIFSGLFFSIRLVLALSDIIASIVVLPLSRNENPHAPLFAWIVVYASLRVAALPILYWSYRQHNRGTDSNNPEFTYQVSLRRNNTSQAFSLRVNRIMDHYRKAVLQFFTMWFVVGNVWIFQGHSSASDAPKLYRLCVLFLTIGHVWFALLFVFLCATICCCLPCSIGEDLPQTREAALESINATPTYNFKLKKNDGNEQFNTGIEEGGVFAAGTEKERAISREDAVCCICLANYADGDELRELPCCHVFHGECVNKWLKMSTYCPLCRSVVSKRLGISTLATHSIQHWIEDI